MNVKQQAAQKFHQDPIDPGRGKHLWTMIAMYRIADPAATQRRGEDVLLDLENLITIDGPGCWKCEQTWTPDVERRFCQGTM